MSKNNSFDEIFQALQKAKRVLITLHPSPDGDSFGCCTAMKYFLERDFGTETRLISPSPLARDFAALPLAKEIEYIDISDVDTSAFDCTLLMDYGSQKSFSVKKMGNFSLPPSTFVINIDHHAVNDYAGTLNYVDSHQPSLCSLLVDFFIAQSVKFDTALANRLLIGVCTDSGFFTYDTNPHKALKDALFLIQQGADYLNFVLRPILYNQPLALKLYFGYLFSHLKVNETLKCGYVSVPYEEIKKLGLNGAEARLGINELQFIAEFDFVFTLIEYDDHIKGSFRSKKSVDVSLFAKALGGGGHKAAASFALPLMPFVEAEQKVFSAIRNIGIRKSA
jgi:phosphoesterase RecJ-like protein